MSSSEFCDLHRWFENWKDDYLCWICTFHTDSRISVKPFLVKSLNLSTHMKLMIENMKLQSLFYTFLWSRNDYLDFNEYGRENGVGEVVLSGIYLVAIHLAIYVFSFLPNMYLMWMFFLRIIGNSIAFFIFAIYFQVFFNEILKI